MGIVRARDDSCNNAVVGDDDVAGLQGRHQDLFDVGAEALAIDRAVEDTRCGQPRDPQRGENVLVCQRPQGAWSWTRAPRDPRCRDVRPIVFGRADRFF